MIRLLGILILAVLIATGLALLADMEGGIDLVIGSYALHTSIAVAAAFALFGVAILFIAFRLIGAVLSAPEAFNEWSRARRARQGYLALSRGLVAVAAGDLSEAKRFAAQSQKLLGHEPLELLLTAQTAQLNSDEDGQTVSYRKMLENPETEILGLRGLFSLAMRRGDEDDAIKYAARANELKPKTAWASTALFDLRVARHEWDDAQGILKKQVRSKILTGDVARRRRAVLLASAAIDADKEGDSERALTRAMEATALAPGLTAAAELAARKLTQAGRSWKAKDLIEAAWAQAPHPDLAAAYAAIHPNDDAQTRARRMRTLVQINPNHVESHLVAAEQAIAQRQWFDARTALEPLTRGFPTTRACVLMAEIAQAERSDVTAAQGWLARAARSPRDAQWRCGHCGFVMQDWAAICSNCDAFDSLAWVAPRTETFEVLPPPATMPAVTVMDVEAETPRAPLSPLPAGPARPVSPRMLDRPPDDPGIGTDFDDEDDGSGANRFGSVDPQPETKESGPIGRSR